MHNFIKQLPFVVLLFLVGCGDPIKAQIEKQIPVTEAKIAALGDALESGNVRNASLIKQYVNKITEAKPELATLANEFAKEATVNGPLYQSLVERLNTVKAQPQLFESTQAAFDELVNIYQAADPMLFSDALSDPLNVLADMSGGLLPRVNSLSREQAIAANKATDYGVGSQLIGNPAYGSWQTGSNGMSFWAWYGMYSMMGDLFGSRRVYYNDWGRNRGFSYYNDYGRKRYSSPSQLRKQNQLDTRTKKSFGNKGFTSAYSKNRTGASGLSKQSQAAQTSSNRFRSATNKRNSTYAKSSSLRNSSSSTSRGFRRGK